MTEPSVVTNIKLLICMVYYIYFVNWTQAFVCVLSYKNRGHQHNVFYLYSILYLFLQLDAGFCVCVFHIRTMVTNIKLFICTVYYIYFVNWTQAFVCVFFHIRTVVTNIGMVSYLLWLFKYRYIFHSRLPRNFAVKFVCFCHINS